MVWRERLSITVLVKCAPRPRHSLSRVWLALFILVYAVIPAAAAQTDASEAPGNLREAAVAQARNGDAKGALSVLQSLLQRYPEDPRLLTDSTIVANWAGADALALELYARDLTPKNDAGVVEAAARSARNLHQYPVALDLYRHAAALSPERWQPILGEALVLTDQGNIDAAAALIRPLLRDHDREADVLSANAYLCEQERDFACVLAMEERLQKLQPEGDKGQCRMATALSEAGAETMALEQCKEHDSRRERVLIAATGAEDTRWGEGYAPPQQQLAESEQALVRLERVIRDSPPTDALWQQAQFDRLEALFDLLRMREVVSSYEELRRQGLSLPPYTLQIVADSYLALRQPKHAESLYNQLLQKSPQDGNAWSALAYAQFEREHIRQAFHSIDQAAANAPAWLLAPDLRVPQSNPMHTRLEMQAAVMRGYAGLLAQEQARLKRMLQLAPANVEMRRQLAATYAARGWLSRALAEERIADSYAQSDETPAIESAEIDESAGRRDQADAILPTLLEQDGKTPALQKVLRDRAIERGWQLQVAGVAEWSSGVYIGTSDQHTEAHLYSPFIDNRWRVYGHELFDDGNFTEGYATRSRSSLGISYDYRRQSLWGEIAGDTGSAGTQIAGSLGVDFNLGDHWNLRAEGDSDNMADVPLIAVLAKVHARGANVNLGWRASELSAANVGLQRLLFTDGNQRTAFTGVWEQRVGTSPRLDVNIDPNLWTSRNSMNEDRLYFNPQRDFSLGPRVTLDWLTWRRFDRSVHQEITAYGAPYWQSGFGTGPTGAAGYTLRWKLGNRLGLYCGGTWNSQPYDGSNESYTALRYGLTLGSQ
jgi:biofilm PGA synthesis protein PgaA